MITHGCNIAPGDAGLRSQHFRVDVLDRLADLYQPNPHCIEDHAIAEGSSGDVLGNGLPGFKNVDEVDQSVLIIGPTRPAPRQDVAERLALANPWERVSERVVVEPIESLDRLAVRCLPVLVVLPPMRCEDEPHRSSW